MPLVLTNEKSKYSEQFVTFFVIFGHTAIPRGTGIVKITINRGITQCFPHGGRRKIFLPVQEPESCINMINFINNFI